MDQRAAATNSIALGFLKLVRLYTYNTPVRKGSSRLAQLALRFVHGKPNNLFANAVDGRKFSIDLTTGMQERVFFFGEYEPFISDVVSRLIREGDTCVDAGANFGWYTTLMAERVGNDGAVHSFEPIPATFAELRTNTGLLGEPTCVQINQLALSDADAEAAICFFEGQPTGHASLVSDGSVSTSIKCTTIRLDSYLAENSVVKVDVLKADVEGAELDLLKGASSIFKQEVPPVIVMEMAKGTSSRFGYLPNDLIAFIGSRASYDFYAIDETGRSLSKINGFEPDDIGANVICIPSNADEKIKAVVESYLR